MKEGENEKEGSNNMGTVSIIFVISGAILILLGVLFSLGGPDEEIRRTLIITGFAIMLTGGAMLFYTRVSVAETLAAGAIAMFF